MKRILGPYSGSVSAMAVPHIMDGSATTAHALADKLDLPAHEIQHHLRQHIKTGIIAGGPQGYSITPAGWELFDRRKAA